MIRYFSILFLLITINLIYGQARLTPRLQAKLNETTKIEYVRVLCLLKDRIDVVELDKFLTDIKATPEFRSSTIINALQEKANQTQTQLINFLTSKLNTSEVKSFQSFWITNLIMVEANKDVIHQLASREEIELMDLDAILQLDPFVFEGTSPSKTNSAETGLKVINADKLWKLGITGEGRLVMNIDTGVEGSHPALTSRWRGNFVPSNQAWFDPETNTTTPTDCDDHGTHTMGIMCGRSGSDTIGVAPDAQWIAAKTICSSPHTSKSIAAFQWAMNPDNNPNTVDDMPDVISNSWYDPNATDECTGIYKTTLDAVEAAGIAVVFSAGNNGPNASTITKPKNINTNEVNVFAVGNINGNTVGYPIANSSSRGPSTCGGTGSLLIKPEVVAPGTSVRSSIRGGTYGTMTGTSMASPHVAGAIALLKQVFPGLTGTQIKYALYNTAVDLGVDGEDNTYGKGLIDVYAAFLYLSNRDSVPPTQVTDLVVSEAGSNHLKLTWTSPFDASPGGAVSYDIRYATSGPILDTISFLNAQIVQNPPKPDSAGRMQSLTIKNLSFNTTYYFAIRSKDVWGNWSLVSNSASGTTLHKPTISVLPDSITQIKPKNITFKDSVIIRNNTQNPSTLEFQVELQNHTFPTKNISLKVNPVLTEEKSFIYEKGREEFGNGYSILGSGGPDQFGYRWKDSREPGGPRFTWTSISDIGTPLSLSDDSYSSQTLNFSFPFYENSYSTVEVVSNGYLRFTNYSTTYPTNGQIPSNSNPNNSIYGFWDDLNPAAGGKVYVYKTNEIFIVEFNNVPRYNDSNTRVTFQIEIQKSGTIYFRYKSMIGTLNSATIGIENSTGTDGLLTAYNLNYVSDSLLVRFQKEPVWLSVNTISGMISSGNSLSVQLDFSTHELINGNYRMELKISSNDSTKPVQIVPINLRITDSTANITSSLSVSAGWNLISLPIQTIKVRKDDLFPTSNSYAYAYSNNYFVIDSLYPGAGFWLKFPASQNVQMTGSVVDNLNIQLRSGWNLIGSLNSSIPVNSLVTNPPGIIQGYIYGYGPNYYIANNLESGKGYWLKTSSAGTLTLNSLAKGISELINEFKENESWTILEFSNDFSNSRLYLDQNNVDQKYELPPAPPINTFDVRFADNAFVSTENEEKIIILNSNVYPVILRVLNAYDKTYQIQDLVNGNILNETLKEGKTIQINNPLIDRVKIKKISDRINFELMQNYPNPFNPSTTIKFNLPIKTKVNLSIFNSLGEKVREMVNEELDAGFHQIEFNAQDLPSGVYFYKLNAGGFSKTRKLVLIK